MPGQDLDPARGATSEFLSVSGDAAQIERPPLKVQMFDAEGDFLTKADVIKLYGQCGHVLYLGSIKRLLSPADRRRPEFDGVVASAGKFIELLGVHNIVLFDVDF